jgi:hypothetical protein
VHHGKPRKSVSGFLGEHGRTVVGHQGPRQAALHDRLGESVNQTLGGLAEVELQVATQPRVIVEDGERHRALPFSGFLQQSDLGQMKVQVPERMDMGGLVAAHLTLLTAPCGPLLAGGWLRGLTATPPTVLAHTTQNRLVARHRVQLWPLAGKCASVVIVQLNAPAGMIVVLGVEDSQQLITEIGNPLISRMISYCPANLAIDNRNQTILGGEDEDQNSVPDSNPI